MAISHNNTQNYDTNNNESNYYLVFLNMDKITSHQKQQQQQQHHTQTHKVHSSSQCSLLTWFHCSFVIILTLSLSLIAFANCEELLLSQTKLSPSTPNVAVAAVEPLGASMQTRRFTRSAIYETDYSSQSSSSLSSSANKEDKNSRDERHLAAFGLRTRYKPQQIFIKDPQEILLPNKNNTDFMNTFNDLKSLNLIANVRDICRDQCTCAKVKNAFTSITCDFQENRRLSEVFGTQFKVPEDATSITIKLATNTNFRLERGFFSNNKVNSLSIEGTFNEREQVEITTEAFRGNHGPYPEIYITNVFSVIIRAKAFSGNCKFNVRKSNDLILFPDAFQNASINGLFVGINDLRIEEKAFNSAQAKLRIESSHIDNIYRFEASLREIRFVNCTIGTINGGTFDVITINSIMFEGCRIDVIKARAITEKLYSEHVSITGAVIGTIESEAIYGSGISELILTKNKIDTIHENAIHVTTINATITRNNIKHLGNNWLRVKEWSNIIVAKNQFGVFGRMSLEETKLPVTCRFESNSLTQPLPGSLNITNRYCVLREISVNIPCKCSLGWLNELTARDLRSEIYCTIDDKLSFCFNATSFNTLKYMNEVCDDTKTTLDCVKNMNLKKINGHFFTPEELERRDQRTPKLIFIIAGGVTLITLAVIAVITAYRCCNRKSARQNSNAGTLPQVGDHLHEFSQADHQIIEQTLLVMRKKYPDIHKQINERIQTLLQRNLSDKKCVKVVTKILDLLEQVKQPGEDFLAFNRILTQHLEPQGPSAPPIDPIYSEPRLTGLNDGFYTSSTIVAHQEVGTSSGAAGNASVSGNSPEHIYAEPNCAQQPLLRNEYASPADGNMESLDLYTEPINERDPHLALAGISPRLPQYATPMPRQQQQHKMPTQQSSTATTKNLPDVLNQSHKQNHPTSPSSNINNNNNKHLTNVQRIAQDLQNMPQFHINPLTPNTQRRNLHLLAPPVYTAPEVTNRRSPFMRTNEVRLATPEFDECDLDMRGATALPPPTDSGSNHSGGSNETVKIDDVILYADA